MNITSAQWIVDPTTERIYAVKLVVDGRTWCAPLCPGNRHYDAFQEWLAEGNEPLPADESL